MAQCEPIDPKKLWFLQFFSVEALLETCTFDIKLYRIRTYTCTMTYELNMYMSYNHY